MARFEHLRWRSRSPLTYSRALKFGMTAESGETVLPSFIEDRINRNWTASSATVMLRFSHIWSELVENGYIVGRVRWQQFCGDHDGVQKLIR